MNTHTLVYHALIFSGKIGPIGGRTTAAQALLPVSENNYEMAQVVAEQDVRLTTGTIEIPTPNGPIQTFVAKPKNGCILEPLLQEQVPP